jgi:hypothetical protein
MPAVRLGSARLAAIEMVVPLGGRIGYGLLGGSLQPAPTGELKVTAGISHEDCALYASELLPIGDDLRVGFPIEYVASIGKGVALAQSDTSRCEPPAGAIVIDRAVHARVGSSVSLYTHLTAMLLRLLSRRASDPSDEELHQLFPDSYT